MVCSVWLSSLCVSRWMDKIQIYGIYLSGAFSLCIFRCYHQLPVNCRCKWIALLRSARNPFELFIVFCVFRFIWFVIFVIFCIVLCTLSCAILLRSRSFILLWIRRKKVSVKWLQFEIRRWIWTFFAFWKCKKKTEFQVLHLKIAVLWDNSVELLDITPNKKKLRSHSNSNYKTVNQSVTTAPNLLTLIEQNEKKNQRQKTVRKKS